MGAIKVYIEGNELGQLFFEKKDNLYGFNYTFDGYPVSLTMPYKPSTYQWHNHLHPIFDMHIPEGYLFEVLKNYLNKEYGYINDYLVFSYLCNNIQGRLTFESKINHQKFHSIDLEEILNNDNDDTFIKLVHTFLGKSAISGVQPKTIALIHDKESLSTKEFIIKAWGPEYPELALNEYFCLMAVKNAGVETANVTLTKNNRFLLVERFNFDKKSGNYLGFEEVLTLLRKNKEQKYAGSYEQVAKVVYTVVEDKNKSMEQLYKTIVMSYLLKNGDAHLKNFGVLYDADTGNIRYAPAYDIVNTCVYYYKDKPALTMCGKKLWFGKKELIKFGVQHCILSKNEAQRYYEECITALNSAITSLKNYISENQKFEPVGLKMLDSWAVSLDGKTYKEVPGEVVRHWSNY